MGVCSSAPSGSFHGVDDGRGDSGVPLKRLATLEPILAPVAPLLPEKREARIDLASSVPGVQARLASCNGAALIYNSSDSTLDTVRQLCSLLKLMTTSRQHQLEQLTLSMLPANVEVTNDLSALVAANVPRLSILRIEQMAMQRQDIPLLARPLCLALKHSTYLQELDLRGTPLGQSQGSILTEFFSRNESEVTCLGLARTNLESCAGEVAGMIALNHTITRLDLSSNRLGDVVWLTTHRHAPSNDY
jgi:hypothetical protein